MSPHTSLRSCSRPQGALRRKLLSTLSCLPRPPSPPYLEPGPTRARAGGEKSRNSIPQMRKHLGDFCGNGFGACIRVQGTKLLKPKWNGSISVCLQKPHKARCDPGSLRTVNLSLKLTQAGMSESSEGPEDRRKHKESWCESPTLPPPRPQRGPRRT